MMGEKEIEREKGRGVMRGRGREVVGGGVNIVGEMLEERER